MFSILSFCPLFPLIRASIGWFYISYVAFLLLIPLAQLSLRVSNFLFLFLNTLACHFLLTKLFILAISSFKIFFLAFFIFFKYKHIERSRKLISNGNSGFRHSFCVHVLLNHKLVFPRERVMCITYIRVVTTGGWDGKLSTLVPMIRWFELKLYGSPKWVMDYAITSTARFETRPTLPKRVVVY